MRTTTLIDRMYSEYAKMLYTAQAEYPATIDDVINTLSTTYYVRDLKFGIIFDLQTMTKIGDVHPYDMFKQI